MCRRETLDRKNSLQTIKRQGEYLLEILNGILDLSRIESGHVEVERVRVAPLEIVAEVAALMRVRAVAKRLPVVTSFGGRIPEAVLTDPVSLRQILINLVANAIKFTEAGQVELYTKFFEAGAESRLEIEVRDTGIGITRGAARAAVPSVRAGQRLRDAALRRNGARARDLAAPRAPARRPRRGRERAGSRLDLPAGATDGRAARTRASSRIRRGRSRSRSAPRLRRSPPTPQYACRVLLAEDGRDNRLLITHLLERLGATVRAVEDGQHAVDSALAAQGTDEEFDLVLMDMQMPVLDGYEATRALRRAGYEGAIVAITANAMSRDRERCLEAGCTDFLTKPVERDRLAEVVAAHSRKPDGAR